MMKEQFLHLRKMWQLGVGTEKNRNIFWMFTRVPVAVNWVGGLDNQVNDWRKLESDGEYTKIIHQK